MTDAGNRKRNKRLLMVCPKGSYDSGGIVSNFQLIQYLVKMGYEVKVITPWEDSYNALLTESGLANRTIPYNWWMPRDLPEEVAERVISSIKTLADEIQKFEPAVVITNTSHIPWGALAASMLNIPHVWIVREYPINNFEYLESKVDFIKHYSNRVMANSNELAKYYKNHLDYNAGHFMSYVDVRGVKLNNKLKGVRLVSPNYISKSKNQIELIEAAGIIRKRRADLDFRVLLMGEKDKSYWPEFEVALKHHGVSDIVDIFDRVDNPWDMVSPNDIMVQTSLSESIGRTTTEAMKLGVPVIATDIPGHREAFSLGGGTLYTLGEANDLADKMEHALDHPKEYRQKALLAQKRALKNMSDNASNGPFLRAIEGVISEDNPMGSNAAVWPYLRQFILDFKQQQKVIARKNEETDLLFTALEEVRNSRAYKLGTFQTKAMRKAVNLLKKGVRK